jgi:hypothetical protein|tara:strand:- start:390 stop:980 length:591 start_codon:yes stop_codon:yes gene_type:complete
METNMVFQNGFEFHAYLEKMLDGIKQEQIEKELEKLDFYHTVKGFPEWVDDELAYFNQQVRSMASPKKPLKASNTFKLQAGLPHEVERAEKERLKQCGVQTDKNLKRLKRTIDKITIQDYDFIANTSNLISFSTPKDGRYIRDIVLVDTKVDDELDVFYIISRKARLVSLWTIKKSKDNKFIPRLTKKQSKKYRQP